MTDFLKIKLSKIEKACLKHTEQLIKDHVKGHSMDFTNGFTVTFRDRKHKRS